MPLASIIENACGMLAHLALSKKVELTLFIDPAIPENVVGDPLRLRQVLVNIINNAIKFSSKQEKQGKVSVRVLLTESNPDQIVVTFQITDNGIGMDKETQEKLFRSFSQGDPSTTRRFGGTGLGLAISHHLAELMDAEITVQSEPQHGSTFIIQMPFKPLPESAAVNHKIEDLDGMNCLILGDNDSLSNDLAVYLRSAGAEVKQISDFAAIDQVIRNLSPGLWLVVIDAGQEVFSIEALRVAFNARGEAIKKQTDQAGTEAAQPFIEPRFVVIKRGRRRQARIEDIDIITIDGDVMYRQSLLRAMAIAAGKVEASTESVPPAGNFKSQPASVSREDALRQGRLILVAEDNDINQKVIRQQLTLLGYAADIANDGREALKRKQNCEYGLLLTDLHMPEMDGFELTRAIRTAESGGKHMPIVALTANALKGEREHCLDAGMDDYLSKPVQLEDLRRILEKYLPGGEAAAAAEPVRVMLASATEAVAVPVNVHVLEELVGDDAEMIREMLLDFRASAEKIAVELHTAYQTGQLTTAGALAHKLKSSARSVGALALGELCAAMEQAGKKSDAAELAVLLPQFDVQLIAVKAYLDTLTAKSGGNL
jgi:CheY-like chemotaxis protein/HPt (histidine-containing phosphotransfer) domain-containing protein